MAWVFSLSAECGTRHEDAERFAAQWPAKLVRRDGTVHELETLVYCAPSEGYWCVVAPEGVSRAGISSPKDQEEMDELARLMLDHLRTAPYFRFADVGIEVASVREFSEINDDLVTTDFNGAVISLDIWKSLGSPTVFEPFSQGFVWRPFRTVA
jgi:hypothetical protein